MISTALLLLAVAQVPDAGLCLQVKSDGHGDRVESWGQCFDGAQLHFSGDIVAPYVYASTWSQGEAFTSGTVGRETKLLGMRTPLDPGSDVRVTTYFRRDAGSLFEVSNQDQKRMTVTPAGTVVGGIGQTSATTGNDPSFACGSGESGYPCLAAPSGMYLVIRSGLDTNHDAIEPNRERPIPDGGSWVQTEPDGGTYYAYAGRHGGITFKTLTPMHGGWLTNWENPRTQGGFSDKVAFVDHIGGYGHGHGYSLAQLRAFGPETLVMTSLGQFYYGTRESTLNYAFDKHRLTVRTNEDIYTVPVTGDDLAVHGSPKAMEVGEGSGDGGCLTQTFTAPFTATPKCFCTGCEVVSKTPTSITVNTSAAAFEWLCIGAN